MRNVREIEKKIFRKKDEKNHAKISRKKCWNYAKQHKNFAKKYGWFKIFFLEFAGSWLAGFGWTYVDGQKLRKIAREIKFSSSNIYKIKGRYNLIKLQLLIFQSRELHSFFAQLIFSREIFVFRISWKLFPQSFAFFYIVFASLVFAKKCEILQTICEMRTKIFPLFRKTFRSL